jgi:hypothetical protein
MVLGIALLVVRPARCRSARRDLFRGPNSSLWLVTAGRGVR